MWETKIYETICAYWEDLSEADLLLIDMPIGLPCATMPVRSCDIEARKLLSPTRARDDIVDALVLVGPVCFNVISI